MAQQEPSYVTEPDGTMGDGAMVHPIPTTATPLIDTAVLAKQRDEVTETLALYAGLSALPKKDYIKKLATIATTLENIDEPYIHLLQLEDLLNQYLADPIVHGPPSNPPVDPTTLPSLIGNNIEFTGYFLDTALPAIVRNLLGRSFSTMHLRSISSIGSASSLQEDGSEAIVPRINQFFQSVLKVIVKHLKEPTKPVQMTLPAPAPAAPAASAASTVAGAAPMVVDAAPEPQYVTVTVAPLFPDSICCNLITTLQRLFDRERHFYYFYDRRGKGAASDDDLDLSSGDDEEALEKAAAAERAHVATLDADAVFKRFQMTLDQYAAALDQRRKNRQEQKEKERARRIEAKLEWRKKVEQLRPSVLYTLSSPGESSHGWLQKNLQHFGALGGWELVAKRMTAGIKEDLDSKVLVKSRRGHNPAKQARNGAFYRKELQRRREYAVQAKARGEVYSAEPPVPPRGSFPSLAPYLQDDVFTHSASSSSSAVSASSSSASSSTAPPPSASSLAPIPLHRVRFFLEAFLKAWDLMSKEYFTHVGTRLKDAVIVKLLHIRPEESRLCDKAYLESLLQLWLWPLIYRLCCTHMGHEKEVAWPILDTASEKAWKADRKLLLKLEAEVQAREEAERAVEQAKQDALARKESGEEEELHAEGIVVPEVTTILPPPPELYEMNLDANELMECITIYLSYQLFCSPLLEKRINGLSDINRMVDLTMTRQRVDHPPEGAAPIQHKGAITAWLDTQVLSEWLMQIDIMDELFGTFDASTLTPTSNQSTHPQLLQRCDEIVKYLAGLDKLRPNHLRQVWAAGLGKHETVQQAIYTLLGACAREYKLFHVDLILNEFLPSIPYPEWTFHTLDLLMNLMDGGETYDEEALIRKRGVALLWHLINLPHPSSPADQEALFADTEVMLLEEEEDKQPEEAEQKKYAPAEQPQGTDIDFVLKQACAHKLQLLLSSSNMEPLRRAYIQRILSLLRSKTSTSSRGMLLWLLPCLLASYATTRPQPEELQRWNILGRLIEKDKIWTVIMEDLARFTQGAKATYEKIVAAQVKKRSRRPLPDAALLVLNHTPSDIDSPSLGVCLADLDARVILPASFEQSQELMAEIRTQKAKAEGESNGADVASVAGAAGLDRMASLPRAPSAVAGLPKSDAFAYEVEVFLRLELLRFIVMHSFQPLNAKHVDQLLHACVTVPLSLGPSARGQFLLWLRALHIPKSAITPVIIAEAMAANAHAISQAIGTSKMVSSYTDMTRYSSGFTEAAAQHLFAKLSDSTIYTDVTRHSGDSSAPKSNGGDSSTEWLQQLDACSFICWRHYFLTVNENQKLLRLHAPLASGTYSSSGTSVAASSEPPRFYLVASATPLIGLEHLWQVCLTVQNPSVVQLTTDLLIQSHGGRGAHSIVSGYRPTVEEMEWMSTQREKYIARCMESMQAGNRADPNHSGRLVRCLSLLQSFLASFASTSDGDEHADDSTSAGASSSSSAGQFVAEIAVGHFTPDRTETITLPIGDTSSPNPIQTVRQLKEALSTLLSVPASKMSLHAGNKELLNYENLTSATPQLVIKAPTNRSNIQHPENDRPMEDDGADTTATTEPGMNAEEDESVLSLARSFTPAQATPIPATPGMQFGSFPAFASASIGARELAQAQRNPSMLLNTKYFDLLFSLLSTPSGTSGAQSSTDQQEISQRVWKLICSLPTNQKLLEEMKSLSNISKNAPDADAEWAQALGTASSFKLLYSLRIISKLASAHLSPDGSVQVSSKAFVNAVEWRTKFAKLGGIEYLYGVLESLLKQRAAAHTKNPTSTTPPVEWDESRNACLALLLALFNFFLLTAQGQTNRAVFYLLPTVLPELASIPTDFAGQDRISSILRSISTPSSFLGASHAGSKERGVNFSELAKHAMGLVADCAKSAAKAWKQQSASSSAGHSRSNSGGNLSLKSTGASAAAAKKLIEDGSMDEVLIKHGMVLLSACVLHPSDGADLDLNSPLHTLLSSGGSTLYSTLLFLCNGTIRHDASEYLLRLAVEYKAHSSHPSPSQRMILHRFLFQDVLLKMLPTLVGSARYAGGAQDYFQLVDFLLRDVLDAENDAKEGVEAAAAASGDAVSTSVLSSFDFRAFFMRVVGYMRARPIYESKHSAAPSRPHQSKLPESSCDEVLIGLMNLVSTLLARIPALKDCVAERPRAHSLELDELMSELAVNGPAHSASTSSSGESHSAEPLHNVAAGLVHEVFLYLFDLPTLQTSHLSIQAPKAKRRTTRISAFNLLLTMVEDHPVNFYALAAMLYQQNIENNSVNTGSDWEYSPEDYTKSSTGYVGLVNLSNTCYLNSMLQQLYMIPSFRRQLLSINIPNLAPPQRSASPTGGTCSEQKSSTPSSLGPSVPSDPSDHLLYQVQFMFGYLSASAKKAYNTTGFCKAFKDYDGRPIDIRQQQDVDEFFNGFCDKLETSLKATHAQALQAGVVPCDVDLVKSTFGGELEHQLLCQDCPHTSFRSEPFCALPLNVKGKASIAASLESFICGETLEGDNAYLCSSCQPPRKVRTLKRVCIKTLPPVLVLNLKRFEFNFDAMVKVKLNDLVSFPVEAGGLNMEAFTAEGLARREAAAKNATTGSQAAAGGAGESKQEESKQVSEDALPLPSSSPTLHPANSVSGGPPTTYSLVGVLLHSGGSESGHYTSLVKERTGSGGGSRWLEMNDSVVREFDEANLAAECFGGTQNLSVWDVKLRRKVVREVDKTRSAYLLIYERDAPVTAKARYDSTPMGSPLRGNSSGAGPHISTKLTSHPHSPDSPKAMESSPSPSGIGSPARFTSTYSGSRAKTPVDTLSRASPSFSRAHSGQPRYAKKLDLQGGEPDEDEPVPTLSPSFSRQPSEQVPTLSPSFSRQPSSSEQKVPELMLSPSHSSQAFHAASNGTGGGGAGSAAGHQSAYALSMPPQIYETVWEENLAFLKNSQLFQMDYFKFIVAFLQLAPRPGPGEVPTNAEFGVDPSVPKARRMDYGLPQDLGCEDECRHIQLASIFLTDVLAHAKYLTAPAMYERDRDRSEEDVRNAGGRTGRMQRQRMGIDGVTAPHALLPTYKAILLRFFANHIPSACWFIQDHLLGGRDRLKLYLFNCSSEFMRDYLSEVFGLVLSVLVPIERPLYEQFVTYEVKAPVTTAMSAPNSPAGVMATQTMRAPVTYSIKLMSQLMNLFKDIAYNWRSLSPFFSLIYTFANFGYNERMHLILHHNIIVQIIDLWLGNLSPFAVSEKYKRPMLGDAETPPNLYMMLSLLSLTIRSSLMHTNIEPDQPPRVLPPTLLTILDGTRPLPPMPQGYQQPGEMSVPKEAATEVTDETSDDAKSGTSSQSRTAPSSPTAESRPLEPSSSLVLVVPSPLTLNLVLSHTHSLTPQEVDIVFHPEFLKKLLKDGANIEASQQIITHLIYEDERADPYVGQQFVRIVADCNYDRMDALFAILPHILSIPDSLQPIRIGRYLNPKTGLISKAAQFRHQYPHFTYALLKFLFLGIGRLNDGAHPAAEYLVSQKPSLYWALEWMMTYHQRQIRGPLLSHMSELASTSLSYSSLSTPDPAHQAAALEAVSQVEAWFGEDFLRQKAEQAKQEREAALLAHRARVAAQEAEAQKQMHMQRNSGPGGGDSSNASDMSSAAYQNHLRRQKVS
jgi:ubiquitin C-terminal hydrolase